ncbi:hypothetical protein CEXT_500231 [Caerostris extrusa]|uniref:Uncharacterized protein n=1 Tax=Caerostris extrusa TaxID=172846 RepID=A0AAV4V8H0_CAEEX|nr:hypothetical protein CEXT_500231 [Caerostris extrusa]
MEYVTFPSSGVCIHVPIYEIKPSDCSASETFSRKYNAKLDYALLMLVFALWNEGSWVIKKFTLTDSPFLDMRYLPQNTTCVSLEYINTILNPSRLLDGCSLATRNLL